MADYSSYRADISMIFNSKKGPINIKSENIQSVVIDYDYDKKNMPIIYAKCVIDKGLADRMILETESSSIILTIDKFNSTKDQKFNENYIKNEFIYFVAEGINYNKDIDYLDETAADEKTEDLYRTITIGMIDMGLVNKNKVLINNVFNNANRTDMLVYILDHMNMVMEPLKGDKKYPRFIIPPMSSTLEFVKFLDNNMNLYPTPFRYFMENNITYLVSSAGNPIPLTINDIATVMIDIKNPAENESKIQGMIRDEAKKTYIVEVDANNTKVSIDRLSDKQFNTIIGVDSKGNRKEISVGSTSTGKRYKILQVPYDNMNKLDHMKSEIENNNVMVNIFKNDVDPGIFTINKKYFISHYKAYIAHNGPYLISRKQEIYNRENDTFIIGSMLQFRKIKS